MQRKENNFNSVKKILLNHAFVIVMSEYNRCFLYFAYVSSVKMTFKIINEKIFVCNLEKQALAKASYYKSDLTKVYNFDSCQRTYTVAGELSQLEF